MNRKIIIALGILIAITFSVPNASATTFNTSSIQFFRWIYNVDGLIADSTGTTSQPYFVTAPPVSGAFPHTVTIQVTGAGSHYVSGFYDYDMDFEGFQSGVQHFGDKGDPIGAPGAGLSWEIGEGAGAIISDTQGAGPLSNTNDHSTDFSESLMWNFILAAGETANLTFTVSDSAPLSGFYLRQRPVSDFDNNPTLNYSTTLTTTSAGTAAVPEPSTFVLFFTGLGLIVLFQSRRQVALAKSRSQVRPLQG